MSTLRTILASGRVALHPRPSRRQLHGAPAHLAIPQVHRVLLLPRMRELRPAVPTRRHPPPLPAAGRSCPLCTPLPHALQRRAGYVAAGAAFGTVMAYRNDLKQLHFDLASATGGPTRCMRRRPPALRAPAWLRCAGALWLPWLQAACTTRPLQKWLQCCTLACQAGALAVAPTRSPCLDPRQHP